MVEPVECSPTTSRASTVEAEPLPNTSGGRAQETEPVPSTSGLQSPVKQTSPSIKRKREDETLQLTKRRVSILHINKEMKFQSNTLSQLNIILNTFSN